MSPEEEQHMLDTMVERYEYLMATGATMPESDKEEEGEDGGFY